MREVTKSGYEEFMFLGQLRYRCPLAWESSEPCAYDTYDLEVMHRHVREAHNRTGKPMKQHAPTPSMLYDANGKPVTFGSQPCFENVEFKEE